MMPADSSYYPGEDRGEPKRAREGAGPIGGVMTQDLGPLPVWGWAAVIIGAVFLWRRMSAKPAAASSPVSTVPAYPAGPDYGSVTNYYGPSGTSSGAVLPTVAPTASSGWGPDWPATASGVVPDRACRPGSVAVENFDHNYWTCMTVAQATALFAWAGAHPAPNPAPLPTTAPPGNAVNCPSGYQLVQAAGGLQCVPSAGTSSGSSS